ncbi:6-phosphogluconolactonase (plasmid) [Variovorax sp. SRS16]|uniref:beta-propeller fold lactonase family protein n=1 Tax=Variovorax sp. SRS16 TaxID=282217 RepID=UPI001316D018|nr:beta-propeller fold lactonase family protein [Variovorax sp. SRS16]VTU46464.1 6-phosphogluconolactonase [Variovorax sp. SRS16]
MHPRKLLGLAAGTLLTLTLAACGGGGGGASFPLIAPAAPSTPAPTYKISGTAAYGHPVAGQTVQVQDATGKVCASTTTASDGSYSMDTTACAAGSAAVFLAGYTTPAGAPLEAVAIPPQGTPVIDGVVNVDPLTTMLAYAAAGLVLDTSAPADNAHVLALLSKVSAAQYQQARTSLLIAPLLQVLQSTYGVSTNGFDPTTSTFAADGQGLDAFFDAYLFTATPTSVQLQAPGSIGPLVLVTLPTTAGGGSAVTSTTAYNIGGTVSGLSPGDSVTLLLNGGHAFATNANGNFTFPTPVASNYSVTVGTQPAGKTCTVSNGTGAGITASVSNIGVTCSAITYTVGGTVAGLTGTLTLQNNGADTKTVSANGAFTFATPVAWHGSSNVTVNTQPAGQTCTVTNGTQSNLAANVTNVNVTCSTNTYTIGGTVSGLTGTLALQNNGADTLVVHANGSFTFATPVAWSSTYNVTVNTQPAGQTCTVTNGSGANVAVNVTNVGVTCVITPQPVFVYVPDYGNNRVLGYRVDTVTGAHTTIPGSPFAAGTDDRWVSTVTTPGGTFLYATNQATNNISGYRVDMTTGALTQLSGSPFTGGAQPGSITINPAGTFAYVANRQGGNVSGYSIDQSTGALTEIVGSPFTAGVIPIRIAINSAGTFAYVANQNGGNVSGYSIDQSTGALTEIVGSPFATNGSPYSVAVNPAGTFAYVANNEASVSGFNIDPATGALTAMGGSPFTGAYAGWGWQAIAVNPAGTFAYASTGNGGPVLVFSIDPGTGALTNVLADSYLNGSGPYYTTFDATGSLAYVGNYIGITVALAHVDPLTGALTSLPGSPFNVGARPYNLAVVKPSP